MLKCASMGEKTDTACGYNHVHLQTPTLVASPHTPTTTRLKAAHSHFAEQSEVWPIVSLTWSAAVPYEFVIRQVTEETLTDLSPGPKVLCEGWTYVRYETDVDQPIIAEAELDTNGNVNLPQGFCETLGGGWNRPRESEDDGHIPRSKRGWWSPDPATAWVPTSAIGKLWADDSRYAYSACDHGLATFVSLHRSAEGLTVSVAPHESVADTWIGAIHLVHTIILVAVDGTVYSDTCNEDWFQYTLDVLAGKKQHPHKLKPDAEPLMAEHEIIEKFGWECVSSDWTFNVPFTTPVTPPCGDDQVVYHSYARTQTTLKGFLGAYEAHPTLHDPEQRLDVPFDVPACPQLFFRTVAPCSKSGSWMVWRLNHKTLHVLTWINGKETVQVPFDRVQSVGWQRKVLQTIASHRNSQYQNGEMLVQLALHPDNKVRACIAENMNVPTNIRLMATVAQPV